MVVSIIVRDIDIRKLAKVSHKLQNLLNKEKDVTSCETRSKWRNSGQAE